MTPGVRTKRFLVCAVAVFVLGLLVSTARSRPDAPTAVALLDRYGRGDFDGVVNDLADLRDFNLLLKQLKDTGPAWIEAGGRTGRTRRSLTAATVALEAARVDEWREWKLVQSFLPLDTVYWKPPPVLIAWGATLVRTEGAPDAMERWWDLAAVAVAERAEDFEFLVGSPYEARSNPHDEIAFLMPLVARFPKEPRFLLAEGIALEWRTWTRRDLLLLGGSDDAQRVFESLVGDDVVGGEALVRLGDIKLRAKSVDPAITLFDRGDAVTRDPFVVYLARFLKGQALEQEKRLPEAVAAYRGALEAIPRAQTASLALATQLFLTDQPAEAAVALNANLTGGPQPVDPWRVYADADDRFWPELIARLRAGIRP